MLVLVSMIKPMQAIKWEKSDTFLTLTEAELLHFVYPSSNESNEIRRCTGSSVSCLLADVISTLFSCDGSIYHNHKHLGS